MLEMQVRNWYNKRIKLLSVRGIWMDMISEAGKGEKTKYRLAQSMKECMKTTSVDNITVKQITENCGVTRQTFYRNFMDKFISISFWRNLLNIWEWERRFTMLW